MIIQTHIAIAHVTYLTTSIILKHQPTIIDALLTTFFAIFPADIDTSNSIIGRHFNSLSNFIEKKFSHRTITHSLLAQVIIGIVLYFTASTGVFLSIMCAWTSHSWSDMVTAQGVEYFYPSPTRCVIPLNQKYRFKIMGNGELILCLTMSFLTIPLHSLAMKAEGAKGILQNSIGLIEWTRERYDLQKGNFRFYLNIEGKDNISLKSINGTYLIIAGYKENGFYLLNGTQKVTACKETSCNWYASRATLTKGEPESTTTQIIKTNFINSNFLIQSLKPAELVSQIFLIGTADIVNGTQLKFEYDSIDSIPDNVNLENVNILAQFRHRPRTRIEKIDLHRQTIDINPLLKRWIIF